MPISGGNAKRVLFGAINARTAARLFLARRRQRGEDFRAFLRLVRRHYRGWHVALVLDEDSSHTARASRGLAAALGIELLWLPKRSPHLNPMDHLWRHAKGVVCANRQHRAIDEEVERFTDFLRGLSAAEAFTKSGMWSQDFWLH